MLKKQYRGLSRKVIDTAIKKGRTAGNRFFKAWILSKKQDLSAPEVLSLSKDSARPAPEPRSRFALIISKKVSKRAVIRNKLRRRIYETIRTHYTDWENSQIIVISVKQICVDSSFDELQKNLLHLLSQISNS